MAEMEKIEWNEYTEGQEIIYIYKVDLWLIKWFMSQWLLCWGAVFFSVQREDPENLVSKDSRILFIDVILITIMTRSTG